MTNHETAAPEGATQEHIPPRYRNAQFHVFDDVLPAEWMGALGEWLNSRRGDFRRGGDDQGRVCFNFELFEIDELYTPLVELKRAITERLTEAIEKVGVPDFELDRIDSHADLYHHGGHAGWHTDHDETAKPPVPAPRLAWCLFLHAEPRMYKGGELEFLDGTLVEHVHNRLVFYNPHQQHRIRRVECWSNEFLHGRWAVFGWVHGR